MRPGTKEFIFYVPFSEKEEKRVLATQKKIHKQTQQTLYKQKSFTLEKPSCRKQEPIIFTKQTQEEAEEEIPIPMQHSLHRQKKTHPLTV